MIPVWEPVGTVTKSMNAGDNTIDIKNDEGDVTLHISAEGIGQITGPLEFNPVARGPEKLPS